MAAREIQLSAAPLTSVCPDARICDLGVLMVASGHPPAIIIDHSRLAANVGGPIVRKSDDSAHYEVAGDLSTPQRC
eukprot:408866-Prymnesium_polylepis.1